MRYLPILVLAIFTIGFFAVPDGFTQSTPSASATAYLNATSPTDRTLSIVVVDLGTSGQKVITKILKDGVEPPGLDSPTHGTFPLVDWQPTWQIPIPSSWEAGTYDITWDVMTYYPARITSSGSTTVIIPELLPPSVTATAYLNATSPTGVTLSIVGVDLGTGDDGLGVGIYKDGDCYICNLDTIPINHWNQPTWQIPVPLGSESIFGNTWEAGTYDVKWDVKSPGESKSQLDSYTWNSAASGTTVIVPALPAEPEGLTWAVINAPGSSTPGCEETNSCFIPNPITIDAGQTVTWLNSDNAAHTATSGTPSAGPDGVWDSSLMMVGGSYSTTFYTTGTHPYFCMVHPWMTGTVIVEGTSEPEPADNTVVETDAEVVTTSDEIIVGSEIQIETDIVNQQSSSQIFAYIVQIKNEYGVPLSISTITGSLGSGQTLTQVISWTLASQVFT